MIKFIHFLKKANFTSALQTEHTNDIVFIKDAQEIYTHGQFYDCDYGFTTISDGTNTATATATAKTIKFNGDDYISTTVGANGVTIGLKKTIGDKINSAIQGVTGDEYVTATTNDTTKVVTLSTKFQDISTSSATAKGIAEAYDVKTYIDNKNVSAEGDDYVSASAADNKVTVAASKKLSDAVTLAENAVPKTRTVNGLALSSDITIGGEEIIVEGTSVHKEKTIAKAFEDLQTAIDGKTDTNTTYTFVGGTNKFTVTPSGGTAQDVTITPSIANNITGSGTEDKIAKFTGTNTIGDGWGVQTAMTSVNTHLPTSKAVIDYLNDKLTGLTGALIYKGTVNATTPLPATHNVGDVYVVSAAGTYAGQKCEVGDYIICNTAGTTANDAHWNVINGENQVSNKNATLDWSTQKIIATVDGTDITVTLPANPNTDTQVTSVANHYKPTGGTTTSAVAGGSDIVNGSHVITGVTKDAAGHVTGITSGTLKIPTATNSSLGLVKGGATSGNTYGVSVGTDGAMTVNVPWTNTNTTYTFTDGADGSFTVTPSGGEAQKVSIGKPSTAGTADKLGTNAGSATQPVYFSEGKPVVCTNSLVKDATSEDYLTVSASGIKVSGISDIANSLEWIEK